MRRANPDRVRAALRALAFLAAGGLAAATLALLYLRWLPPLVTALQVQRCCEGVSRRAEVESRFVPLDQLPKYVAGAVVAAEDARFFQHRGVDWEEVDNAVAEAWQKGESPRGASTITQQLVKNLFLTTYGSYLRKIVEMPLSYLSELLLPKRRILELYLNVVEWGPGIYGIDAAARYHYGIPAEQLSRERAARLAAILPSPLQRDPARMNRAAERILRRMR